MTSPTSGTARADTPLTETARGRIAKAGWVAMAGTAGFVVLLSALHVLRDDLDPSWRVISEYAVGRHGWLMTLAFLLLAVVSASLAAATWSAGTRVLGPIGSAMLGVTAVGMTMAGLFDTDPITSAKTSHTDVGRLHEVGALLDLTPFAALVVSLALLRRLPTPGTPRRVLKVAMLTPLAGLAIFSVATVTQLPASGLGSPEVLIGWPNRLLILGYCGWFATAGWFLVHSAAIRTDRGSA
ncbi:MAG TPA: DUF998 domain-containing protein [Candidatus Limnocylindrales bacterium]